MEKLLKTISVPVDQITGSPLISNEMKIECIGEFSWREEAPYYDDEGNLHEDYVATHVVPWDICKDIYKRMAKIAARELEA